MGADRRSLAALLLQDMILILIFTPGMLRLPLRQEALSLFGSIGRAYIGTHSLFLPGWLAVLTALTAAVLLLMQLLVRCRSTLPARLAVALQNFLLLGYPLLLVSQNPLWHLGPLYPLTAALLLLLSILTARKER